MLISLDNFNFGVLCGVKVNSTWYCSISVHGIGKDWAWSCIQKATHIQAHLQRWSSPCLRLKAQNSFEQEWLFFRKPLGGHRPYIKLHSGTSANDRSVRGKVRSKASSLLAKLPRTAFGSCAVLPKESGVIGRPKWAKPFQILLRTGWIKPTNTL